MSWRDVGFRGLYKRHHQHRLALDTFKMDIEHEHEGGDGMHSHLAEWAAELERLGAAVELLRERADEQAGEGGAL